MYVIANQIRLYYKKKGAGRPIILLHGNGENHKIFNTVAKELAKHYTIYMVDSRGHGKSSNSQELSYYSMAEDIVCFIRKLKLKHPILYGFSDGGIIGLLIASRYPNILSKLMISGANLNPQGLRPRFLTQMKVFYFFTRNKKIKMMLTQPQISLEELHKIKIPVLVLAGSKDLILKEHTKVIAKNIRHATLKILKGESHASYVVNNPKLYRVLSQYLSQQKS